MRTKLYQALLQSNIEDIHIIHQYIAWVKIRRRIHHTFYAMPAHWLQSSRRCHWI